MRGGSIEIEINSEFEVVMTGPVAKTCDGNISIEFDA
jgi:diaminopimelate epimerase